MVSATPDGRANSDVGFGTGNGQFELRLDRLHPEHPHVPDAGSTVTLLGMALFALGFIRRP